MVAPVAPRQRDDADVLHVHPRDEEVRKPVLGLGIQLTVDGHDPQGLPRPAPGQPHPVARMATVQVKAFGLQFGAHNPELVQQIGGAALGDLVRGPLDKHSAVGDVDLADGREVLRRCEMRHYAHLGSHLVIEADLVHDQQHERTNAVTIAIRYRKLHVIVVLVPIACEMELFDHAAWASRNMILGAPHTFVSRRHACKVFIRIAPYSRERSRQGGPEERKQARKPQPSHSPRWCARLDNPTRPAWTIRALLGQAPKPGDDPVHGEPEAYDQRQRRVLVDGAQRRK
mmetsp:Transcript_77679/g.251580  ORF Transcript_77679/g.251580 Transcript_77679/m.251580 type:complete len:286 (+) Transcript_77679:447-1304(+)